MTNHHALDAPAFGWAAVRRTAVAVYLTLRVSALGFTLVLPLVGTAVVERGLQFAHLAILLVVALSFHVFAYVLNDVVDLWVDRSEPLRADSPLVRGEVSRGRLLALACAQPPLALGFAWAAGAHPWALAALAAAFVAMAAYDLWGKRCPWSPLTDAVQSAGWCSLLLTGAWWRGFAFGPEMAGVVAYVFVCVMLVQGVHGALRDLANDLRTGARTTAIWLGARPQPGDGIALSMPMNVYALALQLALVAAALHALAALSAMAPGAGWGPAATLVVVALMVAGVSLVIAFRRRANRARFIAAGAWNIVATLVVLPSLVLPLLDPFAAGVLMAALLLPVAAMFVYNGSHWRLSGASTEPTEMAK